MIFDLWIGFILLVILRLAIGATYSPTTLSFGGGGSTTTTVEKIEPTTPEDLALKKIDLEFSEINLATFKQEQAIQDFLLLGQPLPSSLTGGAPPTLLEEAPVPRIGGTIQGALPDTHEVRVLQDVINDIEVDRPTQNTARARLEALRSPSTPAVSPADLNAIITSNADIRARNEQALETFRAGQRIPPQLQGLQDLLQGELDLIGPRGELASLEVEAARRQLSDIAPLQSELAVLELETAKERIPIEQQILEEQLASILRGGLPSEEVFAEIDKLLAETRGIGTEAIDKSIENAIRQVVEEVAPSRGLRPTDSPILADLERIGEEGVRQKGLFERELVRSRSQLALGQGLQIGQLSQPITAPSLARTAASTGFSGAFPSSFGLTQNATAPVLGTTAGVRGVTTANLAPTFGPQFFVTGRTDSRTTAPGIGRALLVAGIGALGTAAAGRLSRPA